jgi:23S rRNA (guanosine2251-2'-O)-methyltransferase
MTQGFFRECLNPECCFRYADIDVRNEIAYCPKCGELSKITSPVNPNHDILKTHQGYFHHFIVLLDNIRSVYNVGSIIRTCEGFGIREMILSGITPTPDHPRMNKTGLGSIPKINWRYANNGVQEVHKLKENGYQIISLENTPNSLQLNQITKSGLQKHLCLAVGNENLGIDPEIQVLSNLVIAIPMSGDKESFNVSVAFGIAAYHLTMVFNN